jgi:putative membrane protein
MQHATYPNHRIPYRNRKKELNMYLQTASRVLILPLALGVSMLATAQDSSTQGATSTGSSAQSSQSESKAGGSVAQADKSFVMKAAGGGMAEVELGNLAKEKAQSDQVKQFAQRMVDDHGKANDQLKSIAEQKGINLPTSLPAKEQQTKDKLSKLSGERFDHEYMEHMLMDHKKDVAEFKKASQTAKDNDIRQFASSTLPTLQDHLKEAQQLAPKETASEERAEHKKHGESASDQH